MSDKERVKRTTIKIILGDNPEIWACPNTATKIIVNDDNMLVI